MGLKASVYEEQHNWREEQCREMDPFLYRTAMGMLEQHSLIRRLERFI